MNAGPKVTVADCQACKGRGPIPFLTTYDYPMTRLLDEAGVPYLLVGDSLGMVVLGYPDTTQVTLEEMEHHVRACARARPRALLGADLPIGTYGTPSQAVASAQRLMAAGAEYVKAEGGRAIIPQVQAIVAARIPFLGHLGMLPQHVREERGYHVKGKQPEEAEALLADAQALQEAGAFAVVLELVTPPVAARITRALRIPTIGIGSGPECDGQILVIHDLVGLFPWFRPRFVTPQADCASAIREAVQKWMQMLPGPGAR